MKDELFLKQVCKEMGIPWSDAAGQFIIDGLSADEYFKYHKIFEEKLKEEQR
jgi:hypothetical protein